jgi:3-methyladenine DNA glycosylase AlkD
MPADRALIEDMRARLAAAADPERAPRMQAYMKSAMPYHGVPSPGVKAICREVLPAHPIQTYAAWRDTVRALFREATHREEWYTALELASRSTYRGYAREPRSLSLYEELVVQGAWWDIVDTVASDLLGGLFVAHPEWTAERMREWSTDRSSEHTMWKRRASIICQLRRKDATDLDLLYACIEPNLADRDFFIRKAIGWALRQVAWRDPEEVIRYVEAHRDQLSPLSKREALKNVLKSGRIASIP